ncbi:MAG: hypothetical protein K2Y32_01365 [Candidatus Obscuribacterales bacterium]|nr:hypothetical protein [Candidatus Obscuribacterales bacterium]
MLDQRSKNENEQCRELQKQLESFADPSRNHGFNALFDAERVRNQYDSQCKDLGFPSSKELLDSLKKK